jgi:hypothetical protein
LVRAPSVAFLCRAPPRDARQRKFTVRCQKRRTAMGVYRANCYRVLFAVRPDEKRTVKTLPCVFGPLPWRTANLLFPVVRAYFVLAV